MVLGGGKGSRLFPLTLIRSKPAVPLGGKYRLIDIPLSNAINSGLRQVFGTMCKPFHAGKVSREGVLSALLARMGFTSSKTMIEGELGLFDVLTENPDEAIVMDLLGQEYYINHLSIKPYPT